MKDWRKSERICKRFGQVVQKNKKLLISVSAVAVILIAAILDILSI